MANIVERPIVPHNPSPTKAVQKEQYNLFAPVAANGKVGMAKYNKEQFDIKEQEVSLSKNYLRQSLLQIVDLDKPLPEGILFASNGYKTPNVIYLNFLHKVVETIDYNTEKITYKENVKGVLLTFLTLKGSKDTYEEIFLSGNNIWTRNINSTAGDFLPLKDDGRLSSLNAYIQTWTKSQFYLKSQADDKYVQKDSNGNVNVTGKLTAKELDVIGEINKINTNILEADAPISVVNAGLLDNETEPTWINGGNIIILNKVENSEGKFNAFGFIYNKVHEKAMAVHGIYDRASGEFVADEVSYLLTTMELDDIFSRLPNIKDGAGKGSLSQKPLPSSSGSYSFNFSTGNPHWKDTGITPTEKDGIFSANDAEEAIESRVTGLGAAVMNTRSASTGKNSFSAGTKSWARKESDTALGNNNLANGGNSLAAGNETIANAPQSASFNHKTYAGANNSFAINNTTAAMAADSFTHGALTETSPGAIRSRAGGYNSKATAPISFAEGDSCEAGGESSAAINYHTVTTEKYQTAVGTFNKAENGALFMVGNGDWSTRRNAFVVRKDGRGTVGADGVDDKDIATVGQLNALQSQIDALHPPVMEYISMMPYFAEADTDSIHILRKNATTFRFAGRLRATELWDLGISYPDAIACIDFAWDWTPDETLGTVGNISNFSATLGEEEWEGQWGANVTLVNATASRMATTWNTGENGCGYGVDCSWDLEVTITADGVSHTIDLSNVLIYSNYYPEYETFDDGCLQSVSAYVPKNSETSQFFPNTYDFRTRSIDRRLAVALEENRARVVEEFKNKYDK